jgi:hypothetical protein
MRLCLKWKKLYVRKRKRLVVPKKWLRQACYKCEGDAPLVFKAYDILSKLKTVIWEEDQDFPWTLLQDAAKQGAALLKKEQDNFHDAIHAAEILLAELKAQLDEATVNLEKADPSRQD